MARRPLVAASGRKISCKLSRERKRERGGETRTGISFKYDLLLRNVLQTDDMTERETIDASRGISQRCNIYLFFVQNFILQVDFQNWLLKEIYFVDTLSISTFFSKYYHFLGCNVRIAGHFVYMNHSNLSRCS